ncbi:A24 family peptidase [Microbacterium sp. T2.11-28]|uniref:prepilin peptidase n=1 Tax=Microbacterium sp. T2.11-28 TaxID=3041169 RepID=UPI002477C5A2|nr:A24 family peptidase [Microbacterium sp. T2.11-28]CAI9392038.1 Type 4 prepilin-like proteins leader peptide-processing enzyme [Microbacterium sp. T2.11-28]
MTEGVVWIAVVLVMCGVLGLLIGSFLNVVVYRVPAGISLMRESRCPACEAPVRPWENVPILSWLLLRGRCAHCGTAISARYPLVESATGLAFVAVASWLVEIYGVAPTPFFWPVLVAHLYLAAVTVALALIDLDTRRLPNSIVLPSYVVLFVLFVLACLLGASWEWLLRAAVGGGALFAFYWLLRLVRPGGMGGGDVKLAGVLGAALAWTGWGALVVGAFAAFVIGGVVGIVLMAVGRATRKSAIPFGPYMLLGAWVGLFSGEQIARWYLGLVTVG